MTSTAALSAALGAVETRVAPVGLLGLEHEYQCVRDGEVLDFRDLIHDLAVPGKRLDPGDTNAYRCTSGLALTCDDGEAEVASPPLPLKPHFASTIDGWATSGRAVLNGVLPVGISLEGYSTHLSAAMPEEQLERVVDLFAATFAPALMLVLDRATSQGVFIRPRPSRLELCGEYAIGERLRAATAFFAGAARACAATARGATAAGSGLPPPLAVDALVALGRTGLEIDRHVAFGFDLYGRGRAALLPLQGGGTISAQSYLESAWGSARAALGRDAGTADLTPVDQMVSGSLPLGIEADCDTEKELSEPPLPSAFGEVVGCQYRGGFEARALFATWAFTVFRLRRAGRVGYACVPSAYLQRFMNLLDAGRLDAVVSSFLQSPPNGRVLAGFAQTEKPGLWDEIGAPTDLVHPEREQVATVVPAVASQTKAGRAIAAQSPLAVVGPDDSRPAGSPDGARGQETGVEGTPPARYGKAARQGRMLAAAPVVGTHPPMVSAPSTGVRDASGAPDEPGGPAGPRIVQRPGSTAPPAGAAPRFGKVLAGTPTPGSGARQHARAAAGVATAATAAGTAARAGTPPTTTARYGKPLFGVPPDATSQVAVPPPELVPGRQSRRTMVLIGLILAILGAGVALALIFSGGSEEPKPAPATRTSTSIAPASTTVTSADATTVPPSSESSTTARVTIPRTTVPVSRGAIAPTAPPVTSVAPTTPPTAAPTTPPPTLPPTLPPTTTPPPTLRPTTTLPP